MALCGHTEIQMWHPLHSFESMTIALAFFGIPAITILRFLETRYNDIHLSLFHRQSCKLYRIMNDSNIEAGGSLKPYLVFMCSQCRNFTNAPAGQKRRKCSYCGTIIDITKAASALYDSPEQASAAVKQFNAARGGDEFDEAVKRSKDRILSLMPDDRIASKDIVDSDLDGLPSGKINRLMALLEKEAKTKPCTLDRLETLSKKYGLDWAWVEKQLTGLANVGTIIFPRPWTVRLVPVTIKKKKESGNKQDVSDVLLRYLRQCGGGAELKDMIAYFSSEGVNRISVESTLEKLLRKGDVYEPCHGRIELI